MSAHDLMPNSLYVKVPAVYSTEREGDPTVYAKLFTPDSNWTWYVTEASWVNSDGEPVDGAQYDCLMFGLVCGFETELGYFSLREMEQARGPLGLKIERDLSWEPRPLSMVRSGHAA